MISGLNDEIQEARKELVPRKKFSFRSRSKQRNKADSIPISFPTVAPESTAEVGTVVIEATALESAEWELSFSGGRGYCVGVNEQGVLPSVPRVAFPMEEAAPGSQPSTAGSAHIPDYRIADMKSCVISLYVGLLIAKSKYARLLLGVI